MKVAPDGQYRDSPNSTLARQYGLSLGRCIICFCEGDGGNRHPKPNLNEN